MRTRVTVVSKGVGTEGIFLEWEGDVQPADIQALFNSLDSALSKLGLSNIAFRIKMKGLEENLK